MHVELKADSENDSESNVTMLANNSANENVSSGQVVCTLGRYIKPKASNESWQSLAVTSMSAVFLLIGLYLAFILLL